MEAEVEANRVCGCGDAAEARRHGVGFGGGCRRLDPRESGALRAEDLGVRDEPRQLVLDRAERDVSPAQVEPVLVGPRANLLGRMGEQAVQLDALVAELGDRAQRPLEVALAVLANRVELKRDACHDEIRNRSPRLGRSV